MAKTRHDSAIQRHGIECDCAACVVADGLHDVADALRLLGNADASTPMGAMEALGKTILDGAEGIADALRMLGKGDGYTEGALAILAASIAQAINADA